MHPLAQHDVHIYYFVLLDHQPCSKMDNSMSMRRGRKRKKMQEREKEGNI